VFFATTNNTEYLKSQTGNRRFWPVKTGVMDIQSLRHDRDQLWAEAAQIETTGAPLSLPVTLWSTAAAEQDKRREHDPWDDILANIQGVVTEGEERIATADLFNLHLRMSPDKCTDAAAKRLGYCMARNGWEKPENPIRIAGKKVRGFRRPMPNGTGGTGETL
jgi:putative DNA primase/helicase